MKTEIRKTGAFKRTLILRIDPDTFALIEKLANDGCVSKSFITRQLIELGSKHYGASGR